MNIEKIIAVSGKPGLYEILSAGKKNIIVRSISDDKRFPIPAFSNISSLDSIAIFTNLGEVPLTEVLYKIYQKESGKTGISHKESATKLTAYFAEILPDYDTERVYVSNIKKVVQWYNILVENAFDFEQINPENTKDEASTGEE